MHNPFQILRPQTLTDASRELRRHGEHARIYAGGSELLLLLRQGLVEVDYLIDVKQIPGLMRLEWDGRSLHLGACVTHRMTEQSPVVREHLPILAEVEARVANVRVRNVGTIGGNLCFSDPHSDPGTLLLVHDATVDLRRGRSRRAMPLEEFWLGSYETALAQDEILSTLHVPALPPGCAAAYERVERYERPSVGIAAAASINGERLSEVRLAVGCVGPKPTRLRKIESRLVGMRPTAAREELRASQSELQALLDPVEDIHGSLEYKSYIVPILLGRALDRALARAGAQSNG